MKSLTLIFVQLFYHTMKCYIICLLSSLLGTPLQMFMQVSCHHVAEKDVHKIMEFFVSELELCFSFVVIKVFWKRLIFMQDRRQNDVKKHPVDQNTLREVGGKWPDWFQLTGSLG